MTGDKELQVRFTYQPPKDDQPDRYHLIRQQGFGMARLIDRTCPDGREKDLAIRSVEQAVMWANAAIARRE